MFSKTFRAFVFAAMALASASVTDAGKAGTMEIVGNSGVSGQMMFLQSNGQVMIMDKVENNPIKAPDGKGPAWVVAYNYNTNKVQSMQVDSNPFCAGGMTLGDGRWLATGGNKAVGQGGVTAKQNVKPYYDTNGGKSLRFLSPCSGSNCKWDDSLSNQLIKERWYPTVEPMKDGHAMIISGMRDGGFVPSAGSMEPTYEFYPNVGGAYNLDFLSRNVPLSLYPITYLMSNGEVFMQANKQAILWNTDSLKETKLPNTAVPRVYPASGGSAMLPLRPSNNYKETILFCGGMSLGAAKDWGNEGGPAVSVTERPASTNCQQISPLAGAKWENVDDLPEGRSMGQFINLPDGTIWFGNGIKTGVAGYTTDPNSPGKPVGTSFGDNPSYQPLIYDPTKSAGQRWKQVAKANVGRLYHSSATLLPDGSILVSGSNPSPDVNLKQKWKTEYQVERFYPSYYDEARPSNKGLPSSLQYGGNGFTLNMDSADQASKAKVVVIRTGFSTHAMNMGQRMLELRSAAQGNALHVAQLPANPSLMAPGPALLFVVVDGVPSEGKFITVGNGKIGAQTVGKETVLPSSNTASTSKSSSQSSPLTKSVEKLMDRDESANNATETTEADRMANALYGDPIEGHSVEELFEQFKDSVQQNEVMETMKKVSDGVLGGHLFGRGLHDEEEDPMKRSFKKHKRASSLRQHI